MIRKEDWLHEDVERGGGGTFESDYLGISLNTAGTQGHFIQDSLTQVRFGPCSPWMHAKTVTANVYAGEVWEIVPGSHS